MVQIVLPFDFQRRQNWGALVITSSRLLDDDDRVSLTQVVQNLGQLLETVFAAHRELNSTLHDVNTGLPNEAGMRGALEQLHGDGSPSALVLFGIVDRMKYFETIGLAGLAELFSSAVRELAVEASDLSGRFIGGNISASIMYGVFEGSFGTRTAKDDLEARLWRALSRLKLSEGDSNFHPEFSVGAVDVDKDATYADVVGAAYAALYRAMGSESDREFVHWGVRSRDLPNAHASDERSKSVRHLSTASSSRSSSPNTRYETARFFRSSRWFDGSIPNVASSGRMNSFRLWNRPAWSFEATCNNFATPRQKLFPGVSLTQGRKCGSICRVRVCTIEGWQHRCSKSARKKAWRRRSSSSR